ncbi:hypothetical protein CCP1ISM_3760002 [Azospirillaceae bacterium]
MGYEAFDVEQAARQLTGTAFELAEQLRGLIREPAPPLPDAPAVEQRQFPLAEQRRSMERRILKYRLASEFGKRHGWRLTNRDFTPMVLARGGVWDRHCGDARSHWPREFTDHPFFYRSGNRASALVSHPYGMSAAIRNAARTWADRNGLSVAFPEDFPSWWYPGDTTMVVFTRAAARA